ncbi:MAG: hypothetical protein ABIL01_05845 [Pseudomonadota bacterium]
MGKIITVSFGPSRLPRRLLDDGWWLETPPARRAVIAFAKRDAAKPGPEPKLKPNARPRAGHLTLVTGK